MTEFSSEHAQPAEQTQPASPAVGPEGAADDTPRLDRRTFLRALSGSALTLVAGGLTVNLIGCTGAGSGNPTTAVPFTQTNNNTPTFSAASGASSGSSVSSGSSAPAAPAARAGFSSHF